MYEDTEDDHVEDSILLLAWFFFFLSMCTFARHDESQLLKTIIGDTNFLQGAAELGRVHEAEIQTSDDPECNIFVAVTALG